MNYRLIWIVIWISPDHQGRTQQRSAPVGAIHKPVGAPSSGVEQAMKNWEDEKLRTRKFVPAFTALFQFAPPPHLLGAHVLYCPPVEAMHAVTIMSLKAIDLQYL